MDHRVYLAGCQTYDADAIQAILEQALAALWQEGSPLPPNPTVVLKTNLLMKRAPDTATTTHPAVVMAAARVLQQHGAKVIIADSPGGPFTESALKGIYRTCGMEDAAQKTGAQLNFDLGHTTVTRQENVISKHFDLLNVVLQADAVVSLCKLKTHGMVTFTGAVKNLFGCIPGLTKAEYHFRYPNKEDFCQMLVDLCETVKPTLSIMDGIWAMEGDGPSGGIPRHMGVLLVSQNPHACDLAATSLIGLEPKDVLTLAHGVRQELCPAKAEELTWLGEDPAPYRVSDFKMPRSQVITFIGNLPQWLRKPLFQALTPRPVVNRKKCIGCGHCARSCPAHTIEVSQGKAHIDPSKCIKCYCCHELCPVQAIDIKESFFHKISR